MVEDRAVTFQKGDVADLRDKLQRLCSDEDMVRGYQNEAAGFVCGKYNWDDVVRRTLELYQG